MHDQPCEEGYCGHLKLYSLSPCQSSHIFLSLFFHSRALLVCTHVGLCMHLAQAWFWQCCTASGAANINTFSGAGSPHVARAVDRPGHFRWHAESERRNEIGQGVQRYSNVKGGFRLLSFGLCPSRKKFVFSLSLSVFLRLLSAPQRMFSRVHVHACYATCAAKDFLQMATGSTVKHTNAFRKGVSLQSDSTQRQVEFESPCLIKVAPAEEHDCPIIFYPVLRAK